MERTFSVGGVISTSLSIFLKNFVPFSLLALIVFSPLTIWQLMAQSSAAVAPELGLSMFIPLAIQMVLQYVLTGALVYGVYQHMRGKPPTLSECMSVGISRLLPVLAVALVAGILTGLATLLLIVPGLILMCMWWLAIPAAIVENTGVSESMSRSSALTSGSRWSIFGIVIVMILIGTVVGGIIATILPLFTTIGTLASVVVQAIFAAWGACAMAVGYHDLRVDKEGIDIEQIAQVFD